MWKYFDSQHAFIMKRMKEVHVSATANVTGKLVLLFDYWLAGVHHPKPFGTGPPQGYQDRTTSQNCWLLNCASVFPSWNQNKEKRP
jgi:hypothetical protein